MSEKQYNKRMKLIERNKARKEGKSNENPATKTVMEGRRIVDCIFKLKNIFTVRTNEKFN